MKAKNLKALKLLFAHPVSANIDWKDIESLFRELGADIIEREGSRIAVVLFESQTSPFAKNRQGSGCKHQEVARRKRSEAVKNVLTINSHNAVISFDPEMNMFRGEFVDLNGGADFYSDTVEGLHKEGIKSLEVYLDVCKERGIEPSKKMSGKILLRLKPEIHQKAMLKAKADGQSLNEWASRVIAGAI